MSPNQPSVIFSPRPEFDEHFEFPNSSSTRPNNFLNSPQKNINTTIPEEMPMLLQNVNNRYSHSDDENEPHIGNGPPPQPKQRTIIDVSDGYTNVSSAIKNLDNQSRFNTNDAFSNPGYVAVHKANETRT